MRMRDRDELKKKTHALSSSLIHKTFIHIHSFAETQQTQTHTHTHTLFTTDFIVVYC